MPSKPATATFSTKVAPGQAKTVNRPCPVFSACRSETNLPAVTVTEIPLWGSVAPADGTGALPAKIFENHSIADLSAGIVADLIGAFFCRYIN
jgi:hypothetical protein